MTIQEIEAMCEVMIAYAMGKTIEYKMRLTNDPFVTIKDPHFNWASCIYRVKEENNG